MMQRIVYISTLFLIALTTVNCAKRGNPSGGVRDSIPPVIIKINPENYITNFNEKEIKIYFDEYIKLKDINKELIISPPLKYQPEITPLTIGKFIKIKLGDTLKKNTTYSFNFGKSIVDNNEENKLEYFRYVVSTGNYIDSLKLKGAVNDALLLNTEETTTVMLYEINESFNDSIIFKEKPNYITTIEGSSQDFELTNLKEGTYLLVALIDKSNDYLFQPNYDKVGYLEDFISIPTDSSYSLKVFKQKVPYKLEKPKHDGKNHILFGYTGEAKDLKVDLISNVPDDFKSIVYKDFKSDSLHYWFKPFIENDSLIFSAINGNYKDTLIVRMRDLYSDSLDIKALNSGIISPLDTLKFSSKTPLTYLDTEKISLINKDSITIPFRGKIDFEYNTASLSFDVEESQSYKIQLLPGAFIDFFENTNDTIFTAVRTNELSDYGSLTVILNEPSQFPAIVQLVNTKFKLIREQFIETNEKILFDYIHPGEYYIRLIYDENGNKKWDPGNYLEKKQPENVIYYPTKLEIRANWSLIETFNLE
ncbi:Ig-like domain-containing protein [Flavobacteriaceae bacterium]|nr:Ig-like domain-containing protein [Flavobacteriaceae bacterium]|tara:strand:- start:1959 stop:3563 length:1605 start_codon:yes stop_codon:yes gene_type:complete